MADSAPLQQTRTDSQPAAREPLWRDTLGAHLRSVRLARGETLSETADRAGVSPQYLSEMERGMKDPSSEMIAAVAGALDLSLADVALAVSRRLRSPQATVSAGLGARAAFALAA